MLDKIFLPGPLHQAVIDADNKGFFLYLHDDLVRASHNVAKEIDHQHERELSFDGVNAKAIYRANGIPTTNETRTGLVDYGVTIFMPFNNDQATLSERVNLTFGEDYSHGDHGVLLNTRLWLKLPGIVPESALDQLIGQTLDQLVECKGPLAVLSKLAIRHLHSERNDGHLKVTLDSGNWKHELHEAHIAWEKARPAKSDKAETADA